MSERKPFRLRCKKWDHGWTAAYYPMELGLFARVVRAARCPMCGANSRHAVIDTEAPGQQADAQPARPAGPPMIDLPAIGVRGMNEVTITRTERELMRHALGLPNRERRSYRNRFVIGPGSEDYAAWTRLVEVGAARREAGNEITGGNDLFTFKLTRAGADAVLEHRESLCAEDFPPPVAA